MIPAKDYMKTLTTRLQARFGSRLLYVGLQGSYARGEATEASDIDPMVILEDLSVRDLAAYRAILEEVGYFSLSCGFLCGRAELAHWNPLEICHLVHTTTDYYGTLAEFLPAYGRVDVENYVKLSLGNLFHQLCHHYVHADQETNAATLPQTYKGVFFLLQNMHYLDTGDFLPTKKALLAALKDPEDRLVLEQAMALTQGADASFPAAFARLFSWCQRKLTSLPLKG